MAAPKTVKTYPLDGTTRDFEIPFEYLARKFVVVTLIGQDRKQLVLNIDYRFTQRTIITLTRNWSSSEGYSLIEIKRVTSATERLVDFSDGSILRASDLNTSTVQALHIAEEGRDIATDTIGVDNNGQLDARGRQIKNLADAVDDFDAVNYRQLKQFDTSTLNNANRAESKANEAAASAVAANNSRQLAENAQVNAYAARDVAVAARDTAVAARDTAGGYRDEARLWAVTAEDLPVTGSLYSSYHYSRKAAASAASAASSQAVATTQADRAKSEADRAKSEADKLGNLNALGGAVDNVEASNTVNWNSGASFRDFVNIRTTTGERYPSLTFQGDSLNKVLKLYTDKQAGGLFMENTAGTAVFSINNNGTLSTKAINSNGEVNALYGIVATWATSPGANAHVWFRDNAGAERALIYANQANQLNFRCAQSGNSWVLDVEGTLTAGSTGSKLLQNGNIVSPIYGQEGNLRGVIYRLARPRRFQNVTSLYSGYIDQQTVDLTDDVWNYDQFTTAWNDGTMIPITGLKELAEYPVGSKMYINSPVHGWVLVAFRDTGSTRRRLQFISFNGSSYGFNGIAGWKYTTPI